jgi:SAM-dependent methyltransferase
MTCQVCGNPQVESVHGNFYAGERIRYVAHPGYGRQITNCNNCGFMAVEFIHPQTAVKYYKFNDAETRARLTPGRQQANAAVSKGQYELWGNLPCETPSRVLFYGAGRSQHGGLFCTSADEVFACELYPFMHDQIRNEQEVTLISEDQLLTPSFSCSFDLIILSNVIERLPLPKHRLSLCSYLLKDGGRLAMEMPAVDIDAVKTGQFDTEEINYFTPQSLGNLIAAEGSFDISNSQMGQHPDGRQSMRVLLTNERRISTEPSFDVTPNELLPLLGKLSFACFVNRTGFLSSIDEEKKQSVNTETGGNE